MNDTTFTVRTAFFSSPEFAARLAALDSTSPPTGEMLLAVVGEDLWAAVEVDSGAAIADPFRPSADLVELLRFRVARMRRGVARPARRLRLLPRAA